MTNVIRVALPDPDNAGQTYNALTDTDLDHFALISDEDNVLIKEFTRGSDTISENDGDPAYTIAHNLGYIPFFLVYVKDGDNWKMVPNFQAVATVPDEAAYADTDNLYIANFEAIDKDFKWIIFYDNVVGESGITLDESAEVIKIARPDFNALTEKDPNNFIFHSDLNTLKIVKEGNVTVTSTGSGSYSFTHNSPVGAKTAFLVYCKFPDGTTALIPGSSGAFSKNVSTQFVSNLEMTDTQFTFDLGSAGDYKFKYFLFEMPLGDDYTWNPDITGPRITVAKDGYNALTEKNPNHLKFDSRFNTLKYFVSGNQAVNCTGNNEDKVTEVTITNTWGGVKAFVCYVNLIFAGGIGGVSFYALTPHVFDSITEKHEATAYMDDSNLYFKLRVKESGAFNYTANFYCNIFKNDLGFD